MGHAEGSGTGFGKLGEAGDEVALSLLGVLGMGLRGLRVWGLGL